MLLKQLLLFVILLFCFGQDLSIQKEDHPNHPSRFHVDESILKGLEYIYQQALLDDEHFAKYGHDYLMCLEGVTSRTTNPLISHRTEDIGRALSRKWKKLFSEVPEDVNARELSHLMFGIFALERIGFPFRTLKNELRQAMPHFDSSEFLYFDPHSESPLPNFPLPKTNPLHEIVNTKEIVWYNALVNAYVAQKLRLPLGNKFVQYKDILKHLPTLKPYKNLKDHVNVVHSNDQLYAMSTLVWTLSDFGRLRIDPHLMKDEFDWFSAHLPLYLAEKEIASIGIVVDILKIFGDGVDDDAHEHSMSLLHNPDQLPDPQVLPPLVQNQQKKNEKAFHHMSPAMQQALLHIISSQNENGSWGDTKLGEQELYHPTCAALFALCEHSHEGFGPSIPGLRSHIRDEL
eukprot:c7185_g1_i1.p1 GENE.c7185_g1_i1~~c7185_g1_i1.p1  ORF type:complete len:402 (-),score=170.10 c7185_g1_i1:147-1352(-)